MSEINRVRVRWENFAGAPGVSTHFFSGTDVTAPIQALNNFYSMLGPILPTGLTVTVEGSGEILDEATGTLTGQWQHGNDTVHTGSDTGPFTAAQGALVHWETSLYHAGRRVRGRTFLVPIGTDCLGNDGKIKSTTLASLNSWASTCVSQAANQMVVWSRPRAGVPGIGASVTVANVPSKECVLRSRRD